MYIPEHFNQADREKVISFIRDNSFGELMSRVDDRLFGSHLPFMIDDNGKSMFCHLARKNPQWKEIEGQEVLITFVGAHDYISPNWYSCPGVPTWNYQTAHVYGKCKLIRSMDKLKAIVEQLTQVHEAKLTNSWEPKYNEAMLNNIVGVEISITEIQCQFKLNQNRSEKDRDGVVDALECLDSHKLVKVMKG